MHASLTREHWDAQSSIEMNLNKAALKSVLLPNSGHIWSGGYQYKRRFNCFAPTCNCTCTNGGITFVLAHSYVQFVCIVLVLSANQCKYWRMGKCGDLPKRERGSSVKKSSKAMPSHARHSCLVPQRRSSGGLQLIAFWHFTALFYSLVDSCVHTFNLFILSIDETFFCKVVVDLPSWLTPSLPSFFWETHLKQKQRDL